MITKEQAIRETEKRIQHTSARTWINKVEDYEWGWIIYHASDPLLYGGSPYLFHKNGTFLL